MIDHTSAERSTKYRVESEVIWVRSLINLWRVPGLGQPWDIDERVALTAKTMPSTTGRVLPGEQPLVQIESAGRVLQVIRVEGDRIAEATAPLKPNQKKGFELPVVPRLSPRTNVEY